MMCLLSRTRLAATALAILGLAAAMPAPGMAQTAGDGGGRHGGGRHAKADAAPPAVATIKPLQEPLQRLEPGALLCPTEASLQQHQEAVQARLGGGNAAEPAGCRLVRAMTAVAVVERHGPARTEVRLAGPPEQLGWTDALVRERR